MSQDLEQDYSEDPAFLKRRRALLVFIVVLALAAFLYRWLVLQRLEQSSALFIGIPALLSIALTFAPRSKSVTGLLLKGTLLFLALSGIVLGEGVICVAMAAPLFLLIAVVVGLVVDHSRRKNQTRLSLSFVLVLMAMEGVFPGFSFSQENEVNITKTYSADIDIKASLNAPISFDTALPIFFRAGFPTPQRMRGEGIEVGDRRCVLFAGGEGEPGELCLEVESVEDNKIVYVFTKDESHISHWLTWKKAVVEWKKDADKTEVSWRLTYRRELSPSWYFTPTERFGAKLAAGYLMDSYFGPEQ